MLTGDKLETATCTAKNAHLVTRNQDIHVFRLVKYCLHWGLVGAMLLFAQGPQNLQCTPKEGTEAYVNHLRWGNVHHRFGGELLHGPGETAGFLLVVVQKHLVTALCSSPGGGHSPFEKRSRDTIGMKDADKPIHGNLYRRVQMPLDP